jgi:hypothetical protein
MLRAAFRSRGRPGGRIPPGNLTPTVGAVHSDRQSSLTVRIAR